jgi:hypothetical protein
MFEDIKDEDYDAGTGKLALLTIQEYKMLRIFLTAKGMIAETEIILGE